MENLLEEIRAYWSTRTEGYSEVNQKELHGMQKQAWLSVLEKEFPDKPKEEIRILDVGTGPGFFPIILAEAGYLTDAVDYTEGMLKKAAENAGSLGSRIQFHRMDAQKLDFEAETFDIVISRNLTWNLEKPEQAYREWFRVLKKGGKLLNFDANWYCYLYDEEKRKGYENDRKNVENAAVEDYYLCTDIDRMEKIALQVPLSSTQRPQWDKKVLEETGFSEVFTDEKIWERVWSAEEKLNGMSTPMFMVRAVKPKEPFTLGNLRVLPGEKVSGFLEIGEGEFSLPTEIIHGKNPGKTMLITAGIHAGEYTGIQAAVELARELKPENVNGTVVLVKVVCREEFENRLGSLSQEDGRNLNREFPGKKDGSKFERLAYAIEKELHVCADYYVDLHSGDSFENLVPYVYYAGKAAPGVSEISRKMAQQTDVPYIVKSEVETGGSYNYAASCGIPGILIERGGMGKWDNEEVQSVKKDVRSVLIYLGIYEGKKAYRTYYPLEVCEVQYQSASCSGLWYPEKKPGDLFETGDVLGYVRDYDGNVLEECVSYFDGVILFQTESLQIIKDGPMIAYGKINAEADSRKERITSYWTRRSESFFQQRQAELHNSIAKRWMAEIRKYLPETKNKKLRILDVGCGAGFFSILLAKEGHRITGIDLTPDMISNARRLAAEEGAECRFEVMDAEKPAFKDGEFDLVISRNLTWTLPNPEQAYREWIRVLKPGGTLLNFDADYGADNCEDTAGLPKKHAHCMIGRDMNHECEEIKRQLPINSRVRPAWDIDTLGKAGIREISIDLGISGRIYIEKDEFYNPAPMFVICARKSRREER